MLCYTQAPKHSLEIAFQLFQGVCLLNRKGSLKVAAARMRCRSPLIRFFAGYHFWLSVLRFSAAVSETKPQPQLHHTATSRSYNPSSVKIRVGQRTNHPIREIEIAIVEGIEGFHN
jgi:hypothetical protein